MEERTLGFILSDQRSRLDFSLEYVSNVLNIQLRYLQALESDMHERLPPGVYGELFLKKYGTFLSLNVEELIILYRNANVCSISVSGVGVNRLTAPSTINKRSLFALPQYVKIVLLFCVVGLVFGYIGKGVVMIINPPDLTISAPEDNSIVKEKRLQISGRTDDDAEVYVNDMLVLVGESGEFITDVNLQNGINVIKIMVRSRHGKERVEYRKVLVENDLSFDS